MKQVIDTDIFIDFLRKFEPSKEIMKELSGDKYAAFISVLTETEIFSGSECSDPEKKVRAEEILILTNKVVVDSDIARKAAEFRRLYGTPLVDAIIAATAFKLKAILYSRSAKHYSRIKEIRVERPY